MSATITVRYVACDRTRKQRVFKTLKFARRFAHKWVGSHPEIGGWYAASGDGIGRVTVDGCTLADLFPA